MDELTWHDEMLFKCQWGIATYGWHMIHVYGEGKGSPSWSYTLGLIDNFDHPELVIVGTVREGAHQVFAKVVDELRAGHHRPIGRDARQAALDGFELRLVPVEHSRWTQDWFCVWWDYYRSLDRIDLVPEALQVAWTDAEGRFPWEPEFQADRKWLQPLLDEPGEPLAAA